MVSCDEEHDHKQPKPSSKPGSKPKLKLCPYKFFEENVFDKGGNWYCLVGDKVADNLKSESSCKYYKGNWQKTPPLKCGDAGAYFQARGEFDSKSVHDHFNKRCCVAQPKATPKPTPKPKPKAKCPSTCNHKTCDHWVKEVSVCLLLVHDLFLPSSFWLFLLFCYIQLVFCMPGCVCKKVSLRTGRAKVSALTWCVHAVHLQKSRSRLRL